MNAIKLRDSDIVSAFLYCDKNHDNQINLQECREALRYIGYSMALLDLKRFISENYNHLDSERIKLRDFIELARCGELPSGEASRSEIAKAFEVLDRDRDGLISVMELKNLVTTHGEEPVSEEEFKVMIKGMDEDNIAMSIEDFQNLMKPLIHQLVGRECSLTTCQLIQKLDKP